MFVHPEKLLYLSTGIGPQKVADGLHITLYIPQFLVSKSLKQLFTVSESNYTENFQKYYSSQSRGYLARPRNKSYLTPWTKS